MHDLIRMALLLGIAASAVTLVGAGIAYWMDEHRRLTRLAWRALGGQPDALIVAQGRDMAAAFRVASGQILVMRDGGANALLYSLNALDGAELCIDDEAVARVAKGEARRALDKVPKEAQQVVLRLLFDDPRHPEFALDLWLPMDEFRRRAHPPAVVIQEARAWLGRAEALMRRARPVGPSVAIADATVDSGPEPDFEPEPARAAAEAPVLDDHFDDDLSADIEDDDLDPFKEAPAPPTMAQPAVPGSPNEAKRNQPAHADQLPLF